VTGQWNKGKAETKQGWYGRGKAESLSLSF